MFLGIDRPEWIELWAGLLGAIPAAIISAAVAAWVAVTVLSRSTKHQTDLAKDQLAAQRSEAGDIRRKAVMADLLGVASGFTLAAEESPAAVQAQSVQFETATYRWLFEVDNDEHRDELFGWLELLWEPAWHLAMIADAPEDTRNEWSLFLNGAIGVFTGIGIALASGDVVGEGIPESKKEVRKKLSARWFEELLVLPGGVPDAASEPTS